MNTPQQAIQLLEEFRMKVANANSLQAVQVALLNLSGQILADFKEFYNQSDVPSRGDNAT